MYAAHLYILKAISPLPHHCSHLGESRHEEEEGRLFETSAAPTLGSTVRHLKSWVKMPQSREGSILPAWNLKIFRL